MPLLATQGLSKRFPGVVALDDVDLEAEAGEVRAVIGANGAGKSTFMNILAGVYPPSAGEIRLDGAPVAFASPRAAQERGISVVFQEFSTIPELSVAHNVFLGREPVTRARLVDRSRLMRQTDALLERLGLDLRPDAPVGRLSVAERQLVELARALSHPARVLILDEPTAVLSLREWENLARIIGNLKRTGLLILYVSHRLEEVFAVADRATVLRDGRVVATRPIEATTQAELVRLMTGREARRAIAPPRPAAGEPPLLEARLSDGTGFSVQAGEILGLAGLVGAGRSRLARGLAGAASLPGLEVRIGGKPVALESPRRALEHGIFYLTEDRKRDGIFANLPVLHNATAASLGAFARAGVMRGRRERAAGRSILERLRLVARSLDAPIRELSGGNQQKVLIARALLPKPRILVCDEPTRGIDVAAKQEIYELLLELAGSGMAIILISSETKELLALTHRLLVMRDGRIVATLDTPGLEESDLLMPMMGVASPPPDPKAM